MPDDESEQAGTKDVESTTAQVRQEKAPDPSAAREREWWETEDDAAPVPAAQEPAAASEEEPPSSDLDAPDPEALGEPPDDLSSGDIAPASAYGPAAPVVTSLRPTRIDSRGGTLVTVF